MFFGDNYFKKLKKQLKSAGADMSFVKRWQQLLEKVKKSSQQIQMQYTHEKNDLERVRDILKQLEAELIIMNQDFMYTKCRKILSDSSKELKLFKSRFHHEFLISREDKDFHLTYQTVLDLCKKGVKEKKQVLILQSEVENLLAMTEEALQKDLPSYHAMAYFYLKRTDKEISDLPHMEKVEKVNEIFQNEFITPMKQVLIECIGKEKANIILEVELWK